MDGGGGEVGGSSGKKKKRRKRPGARLRFTSSFSPHSLTWKKASRVWAGTTRATTPEKGGRKESEGRVRKRKLQGWARASSGGARRRGERNTQRPTARPPAQLGPPRLGGQDRTTGPPCLAPPAAPARGHACGKGRQAQRMRVGFQRSPRRFFFPFSVAHSGPTHPPPAGTRSRRPWSGRGGPRAGSWCVFCWGTARWPCVC